MDLRKHFSSLFLLVYLKCFIFHICFSPGVENTNGSCYIPSTFKKRQYKQASSKTFGKGKDTKFQLSLIFRKQKDQSMIRSIPTHVRKRKKKKKKKKKADSDGDAVGKGQKGGKKKVNKKLMRRRLLKFYKLKRKNEGTEEDVFSDKAKYSVFDYVEDKISGGVTRGIDGSGDNADKNDDDRVSRVSSVNHGGDGNQGDFPSAAPSEGQQKGEYEGEAELHTYVDDIQGEESPEQADSTDGQDYQHGQYDEDIQQGEEKNGTSERKKKKKKKLKKLKKNMHIGKYNRKIFTYKQKVSVDDVHEYVQKKQLGEKYILQKDTLKNVFVNKPLFNFYNFYNFFQIDHIEKYNKEKVLNLIYYYIYKYKNKNKMGSEREYECVKTEDVVGTYERIADDTKKMKHYLDFYIDMNNNRYLYMNIDKNYALKKKHTDAFTVSNINKVDSMHIHNYKVVWTIRNVQEKLFWRFREMGNIPLTTSAFSFAGKKSFKLKLWLDGHKSAKKGYVSVGLRQLENYGLLEEYICFSLGGITRGPFQYMSREYYQGCYNFCKFDELDVKNDELQLSLFVYDGIV
ncbi:conserved Plasmodium protein, unknown function [Plasmodium knowlesi strain H]|uniref:Uncharacterized protein n=3 Tax=Plasmodium knowlesi TaxID=5850 RepID=A0A5K1UGV1_PLAKH|nr:conserved protein, unknown function [Plasmodium knowlesi strain H]OTN67330.1 Uncharacterized protein PKNOH_S06421400 [Plasmodium knowlesi]CAA9987487.1 conserved protein, unknown function [Plasmodium knowlesi strain H]SBO23191.1 conserved Plasmodium protein, unknown function [Plasmodium knowlesi strain H]SBO23894.1 conserved Plasmodium protein, unknown function [Plasmodium knowlesi strain H]VVS76961.1 conserved protein, unknown function [Plasmodium knowlesi strain H]|eukprot:XP_002258488.1 hypothetical protein, conserved in Plasmodium species [Plasmodium knowlesi strain H]